jgi:hypothetical protein
MNCILYYYCRIVLRDYQKYMEITLLTGMNRERFHYLSYRVTPLWSRNCNKLLRKGAAQKSAANRSITEQGGNFFAVSFSQSKEEERRSFFLGPRLPPTGQPIKNFPERNYFPPEFPGVEKYSTIVPSVDIILGDIFSIYL